MGNVTTDLSFGMGMSQPPTTVVKDRPFPAAAPSGREFLFSAACRIY